VQLHAQTDATAAPPPTQSYALAPGSVISLDDPDQLMVVEAGPIEIYVQIGATRHFLCEISQPGALLFGDAQRGGLLALAPDGGAVRLIQGGQIDAMLQDPDATEQITAALDCWVQMITEGLARAPLPDPPPRPATDSLSIELGAGDKLRAPQGVLWTFAPEQPAVSYFGEAPVEKALVPMTSIGWIACTAAVRLTCRPSIEVVKAKLWQQAIGDFHQLARRITERCIAATDAAEDSRLDESDRLTTESLANANSRLSSVLKLAAPRVESDNDIAFVIEHLSGQKPPKIPTGDIHAVLTASGMRARTVDLSGDWWQKDRGKLIGFTRDGEVPVALLPDWRGRYQLHQRGQKPVPVTEASAGLIAAQALGLAAQLPNKQLRWLDIGTIAARLAWFEISTLIAASLAASALALVMPVAMGQVIDTFVPDGLTYGLILLGAALVLLNVCSTLLRACTDLTRLRIDGKLSAALQTGVMDRVLRLPSRFIKSQASADLALRVLSIEQLRRTITGTILDSLVSGIFGLTSFGLLVYYSPRAGLVALILFAVLIIVAVVAGFAQLRALSIGEALTANLTSLTLQMIQNVSTLRAFGAERRAYALWARNTANLRSRGLRARFASINFETFVTAYDGISLAIVFAVLGYVANHDPDPNNALSTGSYLAFVSAYQGLLRSTEGLARGIVTLINSRPTMQRALPLLKETPETAPTARHPGTLTGALEISHVSFGYSPNGPLVLDDVSVRVEPGKFVAITGPSGCGKSTLMNLTLGFDRPIGGVILYDERNLETLDHAAVRRQIGVVRQSGRLLAGSIFENLIGMHDGTLEDAWAAADLAGIGDDIRALPMGMHTIINEGSPTFSGGQIQRLMVARSLIGRPRLLLLDEATSALDNITQSVVARNIEQLGITRLVVAHRLSTIQHADTIYFLSGGKVRESGTFGELMAANGEFAEFAKRQSV